MCLVDKNKSLLAVFKELELEGDDQTRSADPSAKVSTSDSGTQLFIKLYKKRVNNEKLNNSKRFEQIYKFNIFLFIYPIPPIPTGQSGREPVLKYRSLIAYSATDLSDLSD